MKRIIALVAVVAAIVLSTQAVASAAAPRCRVASVKIVDHLDLAAQQQIESLALTPDGGVDATFIFAGQIAHISRTGQVHIIATLPRPAGPTIFVAGLARAHDGTLYVLYSAFDASLNGVWRIRPGQAATRIVAAPADAQLNGITLDEAAHRLYYVDSVKGIVYAAPLSGGAATVWASGAALAPIGSLGANGVHVFQGALWVSNTDQGTIVRFPIRRNGTAGSPTVAHAGLAGIDDFGFLTDGRIIAAMNAPNEVVEVARNGAVTTLADASNGTENPTSVAIRGDQVTVANGAYRTMTDPNLMRLQLCGC